MACRRVTDLFGDAEQSLSGSTPCTAKVYEGSAPAPAPAWAQARARAAPSCPLFSASFSLSSCFPLLFGGCACKCACAGGHEGSRRECTCVPVHNFVILSMQRSGSTWLETLLDSHPSVRTYDEVFEHGVEQYKHNFSRVREMLDTVYRLDWPTNVKGEFIKETCVSAVGFKWMLGQGAVEFESDVLQYFRERKVTVLMLLRRNKVRAFVSKMVAMLSPRTNPEGDGIVWNTKADSEAQALATFRPVMDLEYMRGGLYSALELENEGRRAFNGNSTRFMLLHYEDLLQDPKIMDEVQAFLGVPVRPLSSPFKRIYSGSLRDKIQNFDEIQKGLQGTPFEKFMDLDD